MDSSDDAAPPFSLRGGPAQSERRLSPVAPSTGAQLGPFFFSSPHGSVEAHGEFDTLEASGTDPAALAHRALSELRRCRSSNASASVLVGAVPLAIEHARLLVPQRATRLPAPSSSRSSTAAPLPARQRASKPPAPADPAFCDAVRAALAAIEAGALRKVVLSRMLERTLPVAPDRESVLSALRKLEPQAFVFSLDLGQEPGQPRRALVGASPELLVARRGSLVTSQPLAGSIRRSPDPEEDRKRAAGLLRSEKDRHEHQLVVAQVRAALEPYTTELKHEPAPQLVATSSMWHLGTQFHGSLRGDASSLELALALHPTPAVCGSPTTAAHRFLLEHEAFDRGYFSGALGYMDESGDGEWAIAIRCAELCGARARLYAGAGVVAGSDPAQELAETQGKMQLMLHVLGLEGGAA